MHQGTCVFCGTETTDTRCCCDDCASQIEVEEAKNMMADDHKMKHDLYQQGDADAPRAILDSNGDVVLSLCRKCGKGEAELSEPCQSTD